MNEQISSESGLNFLNRISLDRGFDQQYFNNLSDNEKKVFIKILKELEEYGESPTLNTLWEVDYETSPVDIMTFMTDEYYLGRIFGNRLFPGWIPHLKNIYSPHNTAYEIVFSGAIGLGKSNIAVACMLYDLYNLLCLRNPQSYHGLTTTTKIVFAIFNITLDLAGGVGLEIWTSTIRNSPYFQDLCEINPRSPNSITLPKNISIIVGSTFKHSLGQAVIDAFLDEANFGHGKISKDKNEVPQVMQSYTSLLRRMESRFIESGGKLPGKLYLVSSKKAHNDFLESHIQKNKGRRTIYIVDEPIYKIRTHKYDDVSGQMIPLYSGKTFDVMIGDQLRDSKIIYENEIPPEGYEIIKVPVEHREMYEKDIDNSIRDISGKSLFSSSNFILNRELARSCADKERKSIFTTDLVILSFEGDDQVIDFIDMEVFKNYLNTTPNNKRAIHIDIAVSGDKLGLSMGHLTGIKPVKRLNIDLDYEVLSEPLMDVDFKIAIKYEVGSELPLFKVSRFIVQLRDQLGIDIGHVSADGYQSTYLLQLLKAKGFETSVISLDRDIHGYSVLKTVLYEQRISMYYYDLFFVELFSLIKDNQAEKIDHPDTNNDGTPGSKDVADSLAGVVYSLVKNDVFMFDLHRIGAKDTLSMLAIEEEMNRQNQAKGNPYVQSIEQALFGDDEYLDEYEDF